jgi:hypothetical protein
MALSKEAKAKVDNVLGRLDKMAGFIQANHKKWGMDFDTAKDLVNNLDIVADTVEKMAYGEDSMLRRQVEVIKKAEVIERNSDEPYMDTFKNPMQPVMTNADEPYMSAYSDDQSSAVIHGKSEVNRPLTSH